MPPLMCYERLVCVGEGITDGITVVAFSPDGLSLAAGGKDGILCIWRISDGKLLHKLTTPSPVFSLVWIPDQDGVLVCGMEDGTLTTVTTAPSRIQGRNFPRNHNFVVEQLAVKDNRLASGAVEELAIWSRKRDGLWNHDFDIMAPPRNSENQHNEIIITSVHWTRSKGHASVLLITYMYHGYLIYDAHNWALLLHIPLNGHIGDASMSPDGTKLVVSNMRSGFDIYDTETGQSLAAFNHIRVRQMRAVPVRFIHDGHAILGGSTVGVVNVWDVATCRKYQPLVVEEGSEILAIDAYCDAAHDKFLIATGISREPPDLAITVFAAGQRVNDGYSGSSRILAGPEWRLFFWYMLVGLLGGLVTAGGAIVYATTSLDL